MRAGFGKIEISTSVIGAELMGYANRVGGALSVNDRLFARTLVLESGTDLAAICSLDLCAVNEDVVAVTRARVAREVGVPPESVFVSATHTHSGPSDDDERCWPDGLDAKVAESVRQACEGLRPVRVGAGWGMLHGHALNRRRLEDPIDPAVFVIRIDEIDGTPLGVYYGFACHPVVLGPDSRAVSADWPGSASRIIEAHLGTEAVAVFGQGACADVNPLTEGMRRRFAQAAGVLVQVEGISYYGGADAPADDFDTGDRSGGSVGEAEQLGRAVAKEALQVHRGIATEDVGGIWTRQIEVTQPAEPAPEGHRDSGPLGGRGVPRAERGRPLEVMMVGIDGPGIVLVGQPGEVFAETGVALRRGLRASGVRHPFVVGYANGWRAYLPPREAYPDGGYEVDWARTMNVSETLQDDIRSLVLETVKLQRASGRGRA
jgi:hypothetical protein